MKVTYTQNRFEIDGIEVINPLMLPNVYYKDNLIHIDGVEPGEDWNLPDNIIAEKVVERVGEPGYRYPKLIGYRLKLKEPLVDTGSKETQDELWKECEDYFARQSILRRGIKEIFNDFKAEFLITRK